MSRNLFGEKLFHDYWGEDVEPGARWPYVAIGAAVLVMIAVGIFA